jgi:hypothetical protein
MTVRYSIAAMVAVIRRHIEDCTGQPAPAIFVDPTNQRELYLLHLAFQRVTNIYIQAE